MKAFRYFYTIALLAIFLVSCSDDDNPTDTSGVVKLGEMTATLAGKSFKSDQAQAMDITVGVQISGLNISGESISLVAYSTVPGTYTNGLGFVSIVPNFNPALTETYSAKNVTYTIKSNASGEIEGSFAFTADRVEGTGSKQVSNAKFKVKLVN